MKNSDGITPLLPLPSGAVVNPSATRRDLLTIIKSLKNHSKNGTFCRDYVISLHSRIFDDAKEGADTFAKFVLNATGGLSTLLSTMDINAGDGQYCEVAMVFVHNLIFFGGRRNLRVCAKLIKRGIGRITVSVINKNVANMRVIHPATMVVLGIGAADSKLPNLARLSGCLSNLLNIARNNSQVPKQTLASTLACLFSLSRGDANVLHLWKKGAVSTIIDVCGKHMHKPGSPVLRWAIDLLSRMCSYDESVRDVIKESGVSLVLNLCYEQANCVEVQVACIELIRLLIVVPDGMAQFETSGGFRYLLTLITENNYLSKELEWLQLINALYKLYDLTELPIGNDNDLIWIPPESGGLDGQEDLSPEITSASLLAGENASIPTASGGSAPTSSPTSSGGANTGAAPSSSSAPLSSTQSLEASIALHLRDLGSELYDGEVSEETSLDATAVHHLKPFTDPRPSPSCPPSISFVPPVEDLLYQTSAQRIEILKRNLRRLTHASILVNRVVFDDLARDSTLPPSKLGITSMGNNNSFFGGSGGLTSPSSQSVSTFTIPSTMAAAAALTTVAAASSPTNASSKRIPTLRFGSNFECGNLKRAIQIMEDEYDLILHSDINTSSYIQWFYFSIEKMRPDVTYRFNIINMEKPTSTFNDGQRPLLFSEKRFLWTGFGWLRSGHDILYNRNSYKRPTHTGKKRRDAGGYFYSLSFSIRFPHEEDRCYISNCYPYSYSDLMGFLRGLQSKRTVQDFFMAANLCPTQCGNACPLVTITTLRKDGVPCSADEIQQRPVCVVSARVHPGESNASYVCKGLLEFLLEPTNEHAQFLRDTCVWKIVPMLNPDGVINGNHRCALSGKDLNREFLKPDMRLNPTIYYLKELVRYMKFVEGRNIVLYGDFHGHSRCRNSVIYACSARKPTAGIVPEKIMPRMLSELTPFFSFNHTTYKVQRSKRTTGRVVFYREMGVRMSYTLEASMMGGYGCDFLPLSFGDIEEDVCRRAAFGKMTYAHFNTGHYQTLGVQFVRSFLYVLYGERGQPSRVNDIISELLVEAASSERPKGGAQSVGKSPTTTAPEPVNFAPICGPLPTVSPTSNALKFPSNQDQGGGDSNDDDVSSTSSFTGTYANSKRSAARKKKVVVQQQLQQLTAMAQNHQRVCAPHCGATVTTLAVNLPAASTTELQDIYKVLLRNGGQRTFVPEELQEEDDEPVEGDEELDDEAEDLLAGDDVLDDDTGAAVEDDAAAGRDTESTAEAEDA